MSDSDLALIGHGASATAPPEHEGKTELIRTHRPADKTGLAAALLNTSQQLGEALGVAIFSAIATSRTNDLLAAHTPSAVALTSGFQRALLASSMVLVAAAFIALRTSNARVEVHPPLGEKVGESARPLPARAVL